MEASYIAFVRPQCYFKVKNVRLKVSLLIKAPSRVSDHPRPWLEDKGGTFSRGTVYRSSMPGLVQQHGGMYTGLQIF